MDSMPGIESILPFREFDSEVKVLLGKPKNLTERTCCLFCIVNTCKERMLARMMSVVGDKSMIRVKVMGKSKPGMDEYGWAARFPGRKPIWGNCHFLFDRHERDYDWLVVYDDLPSVNGEKNTMWIEELACPREHTILITSEPSSIKIYGSIFLRQFQYVLTSQEPWAVGHHPGAIYHQPGLILYYAFSEPRGNIDHIIEHVPLEKTHDLSAVCSAKRQRHTLHNLRYRFILDLKQEVPEMQLFGRGIHPVEDKADALDRFKYHVAVENFLGLHHWTEKLADPFIGACMPIYYGCPNAEDYFPAESFLRIDINDVGYSADIIRKAIRDRAFEKCRSAILESRRLVLEKYSTVPQIVRFVNELNNNDRVLDASNTMIASRHACRKQSLVRGFQFGLEKTIGAMRNRLRLNESRAGSSL